MRVNENQPRSTKMSRDLGELVDEPLACPKCGYNLLGLTVGMPCPECATLIAKRRKTANDHMGNAPAAYLNTLASALVVFGVSGLLIPMGAMLSLAVGVNSGAYAALASVAVLPIAGMVILRKRVRPHLKLLPEGEMGEWVGLRRGIVVGYVCMYLTAGLFVLRGVTGIAIPDWVIFPLATASGAGLCLAAWHISLLADWARDDKRAQQFRSCSMGFGLYLFLNVIAVLVTGPLANLLSDVPLVKGLASFFGLIQAILSVFAFGCLLLIFIFSMLFASTVRWSIHNARTERERDARIAARNRKRAEELVARTAAASEAAAPEFETITPEEAGVTLIDSGADLEEAESDEDDREYNPYGLED